MNTSRRYRRVVTIVALLTMAWVMVPATGALAVDDPCVVAFSDDMESGDVAWSTTNVGGVDWALGMTNPYSPTHAWFGIDIDFVADQYLATVTPIPIQGYSLLRFWHDYDLEAASGSPGLGYDGGVVEVSPDGGTTWVDVGTLMTVNGYTRVISGSFGSPIADQAAFSGDSGGYIMTEVDMTVFNGHSVLIRFRLATDTSVAGVGWWIDDVSVLTNSAPIAHPDAYSVDEDQLLMETAPGVLGNDSDPDADPIEAVLDTGPSFGRLFGLNADGSFRYEPDANYNGPDRFSYHATDGLCGSETVLVNITVDAVNDRPIAVPDSYGVTEDTPLEIEAREGVLANDSDVDEDSLRAVLITDVSHGTLTLTSNGSFRYVPDPDYEGMDGFRYRATDGMLNSNTVAVELSIRAVNDAPIAVADEYDVLEDEVLTVPLPGVLGNDIDVDGDELTAHLDVGTSDGDLTTFRRSGSFVYEPDANFNGMDQFGYHANDGAMDSEIVRVKINVIPVNDVPVAVADEYTTNENQRLVIGAPGVLVNDTDVDGDRLWAELVDGPMHGDLSAFARNGSFTYVPDLDFGGTDYFSYYATDSTDDSDVVRVTIIVIPDNEAPEAVADEYEVAKNGKLTIAAPGVLGNDSDPDGDPLTAALETGPVHGTLTLNADGSFMYEPDTGYVGVDGFRYYANDGEADSNTVRAVIHVKHECNGVIATIVGTNGADIINGTSGDDVIVGLKGADVIHGGAGNDLICGDGGFDKLYGDEGNDRLEGWAGNDRLFGGDGDDFLKGEGRNDLLKGGNGEDTLVGGKGYDRMFGNRQNDLIKAKDGEQDKMNGGYGFDTAIIDSGLDIWTSIEKFL